jgi:hypothetical protein
MPSRFDELRPDGVRTLSIRDRKSKVDVSEFARPAGPGATVAELIDGLPRILAAAELRTLLDRVEAAVRARREWILLLGGHVVKTGVSPCLIPFIRRRSITCVAMNGSAAVHDVEIARHGRTSEVVEESLADGSFGMARETAEFLNTGADQARDGEEGFGERLGARLLEEHAPHAGASLLAACAEAGVPGTVHVALGTDIVHQHPSAHGDSIGDASLRDFRILSARVAGLEGGVVLNAGSAVLMPEVFLKALTVARNLGNRVEDFGAANFDMIRQYRPLTNVVRRPTAGRGWGADFAGHHEILIPLLCAALEARLGRGGRPSG